MVQLFSVIVSSIERGKSIEEICRIGDKKVNNLKDSKKNIMNYYIDNSTNNVHQYFENINGEVIGFNKGIIEKTFCDNNHANELCQFVDDVKDRLSQISEMNETQKRYFENILDGLKEPDLKNNEVQKNNLKMRFESFIMGLLQKIFKRHHGHRAVGHVVAGVTGDGQGQNVLVLVVGLQFHVVFEAHEPFGAVYAGSLDRKSVV